MNEVKLLNIGGIDQNVKDQYARDIIAPSENGLDSTSNLPVASRHYDAGEFLIGQDRLYYEALVEINVGDTLVVNSNIKATTVSAELVSLRSKSADAAIECIAPMEKTGLSSAEYKVGEYLYWDYGTNAGLYKAKILINVGDAFVVDTNIEAAEPIAKTLAGLRALSNPNLLDNPWFTVNQRGASSYTSNGYCVDRWYALFMDVSVVDNGISCQKRSGAQYNPVIRQMIIPTPDLRGKTLTLSVDIAENNNSVLLSVYKTLGINTGMVGIKAKSNITGTGIYSFSFTVPNDVGTSPYPYLMVGIDLTSGNESVTIRAVKLELGSVSTLANDTAPNYTMELAKCRASKAGPNDTYANQGDIIQAKVFGELGAKNLLLNNAVTQTINGITYTVNSDSTVKANGTASPNTSYLTLNDSVDVLPNTDYILSGCPLGGSAATYVLYIVSSTDSSIIHYDTGNGVRFNSGSNTKMLVFIRIIKNTTASNLVFKPMIRPASIADDTYAPYAMTNRELTESRKMLTDYRETIACPSTSGEMVLRSHTISEDGTYLIIGHVVYSYSSSTEICISSIIKSGTGIDSNRTSMESGGGVTSVTIEPCSKGDILKLMTYGYAGHTGQSIRYRFEIYKLF